jgi:hypothetical protein
VIAKLRQRRPPRAAGRAAAGLRLAALSLLAAACVGAETEIALNGPGTGGAGEEGEPAVPGLLLSAGAGPHRLAGTATRIELAPPPGLAAADAAARLAALDGLAERRLRLVLRDLFAPEPPGTLYQLYLGLDPDEEPAEEDARALGSLNFFGVETGGGTAELRSYDVTALAPLLATALRAGRAPALTVRSASPAAGAAPSLGRVELVAGP